MGWVDRLVAVTGWRGDPGEYDWFRVEEALGVSLPADFKALRRNFAEWGAFSDHILILEAQEGSESVLVNHHSLLRSVKANPDNRRIFEPFGLFGSDYGDRSKGLLQWGYSFIEEEYYWLADASKDPSTWPVMARADPLEPFQRFDMNASEFVFHALTEPEFSVFSVAAGIEAPFFRAF